MSVPDHRAVPLKLFQTGLYDLKVEAGQGAFVDACVSTLNGMDPKWGHLRKKPGQSQVHWHGEDSALYLSEEPGQSQAVDFISGAGGPNPQPGWFVDAPRYSASDWADPADHRYEVQPVPQIRIPSYGALGDDAFFRNEIGVPLQADMLESGQPLNDGSAVWFSRPIYELLTEAILAGGMVDPAPIVRKYRNQWRAILRLPPV